MFRTQGSTLRRTALITGGGTGIGRGIALALARRGVDLALVGRRVAPLHAVADEAGQLGVQAVALPADLARSNDRATLLERVHAALGPIDILVHNAGVIAGGELASLTTAHIERAITVNLLAPLELTRQALPELAARRGAVVLVASTMALVPMPSAAVYSATKAGLRAFGTALHYELVPSGVRLLTAYPPGTDTALITGMAAAAGVDHFPLARPEVVGERIVVALMQGKRELRMGAGERMLARLYQWMPWVVTMGLRMQRQRFVRMLAATRDR